MSTRLRSCPLCGSALSATRFAQVMQRHRGLEEELAKLKSAQDKARLQLARARDEARAAASRARAKATKALDLERRRAADRLKRHQAASVKLRSQLDDLQRRLKHGETAQSEGLLEEKALLAFLKAHYADGRLTDHELAARSDAAYRAVGVRELEWLISDLPSAPPEQRHRLTQACHGAGPRSLPCGFQ